MTMGRGPVLGWLGMGLLLMLPGRVLALTGTANEIDIDLGGRIGLVDPLIVGKGGTGLATLTDRAVVIGRAAAAVEFAAPGNAGGALLSTGATTNPTFGALDLADADARTGTLGAGNGGTGQTAVTEDGVLIGNGTSFAVQVLTDCTGAGKAVTYTAATNTWGCNTISGSAAPPIFMSTLGDLVGGQTTFIAPGTVDATQGRAQQIAPETFSLDGLHCVSSAAPGTSNTYIITMQDGVCTGALTNSTGQTCTISGAATRTCAEAGAAEAVTVNECWDLTVVSLDADTASAIISCSALRTA